ncbi:MAG: histidinol dehydrogenase [Candidatus Micrarchaeota archaeon]|nr:histidinol dehydrogenase [Candidatus Micrarchaeota archaeon]
MMEIVRIYELEKMSSEDRERIMKRAESESASIENDVRMILENVKKNGDNALFDYMNRFNKVNINSENVRVTKEEIKEAYERAGKELIDTMRLLAKNVRKFHELQKPKDWMSEISPGLIAGQVMIPIDTVGCYSPGGRGWFPTTMLMNIIPAKVAGVRRVIVCTPPMEDGSINPGSIVAADIAGADEIYKLSGAQSIAAMAYGTESIPRVNKITGPGGIWVVTAKKLVKNVVGIDVEAGPGECGILADETANPDFVAADIITQAEHGNDSSGLLVTPSMELAKKVQKKAGILASRLPKWRKEFVENSLAKYGAIVVTKTLDEAIDFINDYSAEHLEIMTENPLQIMKRIKNAGAIYLGPYAPTSAGCYCSGPNHVLPTGPMGKLRGGLNTEDFIKKVTFEYPTKEGLGALKDAMLVLSDYEQFYAHGNAIRIRFEE